MMSTTEYLSQSVKQCIDDHLGAIDDTLRNSGFSQSERQNILDDVETQIHDMLINRAPGKPTVEDARAVLAEMDPPESYAGEENPPPAVGRHQDDGVFVSGKQALWLSVGIYVSIFLFFGLTAFLMIKVYSNSATASEFALKTIMCYSVLFAVVSTAIVFVYIKFIYLKHRKKTTVWIKNMTVFEKKVLYYLLGALVFFAVCYLVLSKTVPDFRRTWIKEFFGVGIVLLENALGVTYIFFYLRSQKRK